MIAAPGVHPHRAPALWLGLGLLGLAAVPNAAFVERLIPIPDDRVAWLGYGIQAGLLALGAWFVLHRPTRLARGQWVALALVGTLLPFGAFANFSMMSAARRANELGRLHLTEQVLLTLQERVRPIERDLLDLELFGPGSRELLHDQVVLNDIEEPSAPSQLGASSARRWTVTEPAPVDRRSATALAPLLDRTRYLDHVHLKLKRGAYAGDDLLGFDADARLTALGASKSGDRFSLKAKLRIGFRRDRGALPFRIARMILTDLETREAPALWFTDALDGALAPEERARARRSRHEEYVREMLRDPQRFEPPHPNFTPKSHDRHPGVSVADVDGDGWDDVYVMAEWGKNQLFINRRDGTFAEEAERFGLAISDHSSSAVFADFDNDGDRDVFVGRTLAPSVYLENADGRYIARDVLAAGEHLPALVSSISVADIDRDGLLDVYFATYFAQGSSPVRRADCPAYVDEKLAPYLPAADADRLCEALSHEHVHVLLDRPGPPNVLLRNLGRGRFERVRETPLGLLRNSYQCGFADYDDDADPDVYCANDFAPNQLFQNDGKGSFRDVTDVSGTADPGLFSMSVAWGDYDRDGDLDLYVSNMHSSAGERITAAVDGIDRRFVAAAVGNTLFRQSSGVFDVVSGDDALPVNNAGWAWASQMLDVDNDAHLDIFSLSGYYTAPAPFALPVDT